MKLFCCVVFFSAFLFALAPVHAQYVQFTENKGQWDNRVLYTGDAGVAQFFLQKNGYRVLLNDTNDIKTIQEYFTGHHTGPLAASNAVQQMAATSAVSKSKSTTATQPSLMIHSHAYDVTFAGASANPQIFPDKSVPSYNNYFIGSDSTKWASHCKIFQAVLYKNMYPGIDVRYYTNNGQLKYDIIVNPGADISKLALQFTGADGLSIKKGNLVIKTSVGDAMELAPVAYQATAAGRENVDIKFYVSGNTVYFKTGAFSKTTALIIDPALVFSSLSGSLADNWGYTATYDGPGNFYAGGIAFEPGYPVSPGAFQQTFSGGTGQGGGFDVALIKLSSNGSTKVFATYLGGSGNEQPHSMVVDNTGHLIVAGRTNSSNFPTTLPRFGQGGNWDIFITKFSPDGSKLSGSIEIGGTGDDGVNEKDKEELTGAGSTPIRRNYGDDARSEVIVDASNNIYLASCTQSTDATAGNLLSTPGAFQTQPSGQQDGLLVKADPNLNILFSSYLGGKGDDAAFVLSLSPINNDIYVGGATTSNNLASTSGNAGPILNSTYQQGACDGFISIISNDGSTLKKTVYVGGAGNDMLYGLQFDKLGYPYIMGTTTLPFPVINSAFGSQSNGNQFITKLAPDLSSVEYSTNFGKASGLPDLSPVAFLVDRCENVYVSGWGGGINKDEGYPNAATNGLSVTPNAIQAQTNGSNFYFFVLKKNGDSQLYGTYFGELTKGALGDHVDGGTSRFDNQGVIYQAVCANCGKTGNGRGFPTTGGVYARTNQSVTEPNCNEAAVKIAFQLAGVTAGIRTTVNGIPNDSSGCVPLTVDFTDTIAIAKQYSWNFEDGSTVVNTTARSVTHIFNNVGNYRVQLIAIDSTACNIADTIYVNIRARNDYAAVSFSHAKLLPCTSLTYQFVNTSQAPADKPFSDTSFIWNFGDGTTLASKTGDTITHIYTAQGTYTASLELIDTNYCNAPQTDSVQLRISSVLKAQFIVPPGCAPYVAAVDNTSLGGQSFVWDFGDGTSSTATYPQHLYANNGRYTIKLTAYDSSTCNTTDSAAHIVLVDPSPSADFSSAPLVPQANTPITFLNNSSGGTRYLWDFGDGDTLATIQQDTAVSHIYNTSGAFSVMLVTYNQFSCTDTAYATVQAIVIPLVDLPNAFTPNGDNVNDRIQVRGYGIEKMDWKIYNRWGVLVFAADSQEDAWDGYYNGKLQPQDVYVYVLNVVFSDGTKYQKKGDITLLR